MVTKRKREQTGSGSETLVGCPLVTWKTHSEPQSHFPSLCAIKPLPWHSVSVDLWIHESTGREPGTQRPGQKHVRVSNTLYGRVTLIWKPTISNFNVIMISFIVRHSTQIFYLFKNVFNKLRPQITFNGARLVWHVWLPTTPSIAMSSTNNVIHYP